MHRWVRGITVGVGGVALVAATIGAGMSPAGAQRDDDAHADADALVWNDQFATVEVENDGSSSTGDNTSTALSGNLVIIGQGASADAFAWSQSRDELLAWFYSEGFANWFGHGGLIDTGFQVIPGSPVVLPVLAGTAENLIQSITNTASGMAAISSGDAAVQNGTGVTLAQTFQGNGGATATADASSAGGDADSDASAEVANTQTAHVGVSNDGYASSGGNRATTANGNAVVIGQGASAGAAGVTNGNAGSGSGSGSGGGSVTGGTASNTVGSVSNTATGQATIQTGDATVSNSTNVSVTQSNSGNGGATADSTASATENGG